MADYGLPTGSLLDEAPSGVDWSGSFWTVDQQLEDALSSLSSAADQLSSLYGSETYRPLPTQIPNYATTPSLSAGSTSKPYAANAVIRPPLPPKRRPTLRAAQLPSQPPTVRLKQPPLHPLKSFTSGPRSSPPSRQAVCPVTRRDRCPDLASGTHAPCAVAVTHFLPPSESDYQTFF